MASTSKQELISKISVSTQVRQMAAQLPNTLNFVASRGENQEEQEEELYFLARTAVASSSSSGGGGGGVSALPPKPVNGLHKTSLVNSSGEKKKKSTVVLTSLEPTVKSDLQLSKEEQLLRERKRITALGITSYSSANE